MNDSDRDRAGEAEDPTSSGGGGSSSDGSGGASENEGGGESPEVSVYEWIAGAFSALLVLALLGFLFYEGFTTSSGPPELEVTADTVYSAPSGWIVEFKARNRGDATAATLVVEGRLIDADTVVERSQATVDYVPRGGSRRGGLVFVNDPNRYALEISPRSYDLP